VITYLLWVDPLRTPVLRHEVEEPVEGPSAFGEHEGRRIVVGPRCKRLILRQHSTDPYSYGLQA
jgi:hypothetical protein